MSGKFYCEQAFEKGSRQKVRNDAHIMDKQEMWW